MAKLKFSFLAGTLQPTVQFQSLSNMLREITFRLHGFWSFVSPTLSFPYYPVVSIHVILLSYSQDKQAIDSPFIFSQAYS